MAGESYLYTDVFGNPTRRVVKYPNKEFRQFHPEEAADGKIEWKPGAKGPGEPYMLPEILDAIGRGETVYWVEGEKDANNLAAYGQAATTTPNGSSAPWADQWLIDIPIGSKFVVVADYDRPGFKHAKKIAEGLRAGRMVVVDVVRPAVGEFQEKGGKDATDHLEADLTVDEMVSCEHELEQRLKSTNPPPKRNHLRDASFDWAKWALQFQEENDTGRNETAMHLVCQLRDNDVEQAEAWRWVERYWEAIGEPDDFTLDECKTVFDKNFFTPKREAWGQADNDELPDFLPEGYKIPNGWRVKNNKLEKLKSKDLVWYVVSDNVVWITGRIISEDGRAYSLEVRWEGGNRREIYSRDKLMDPHKMLGLSAYGFPVVGGAGGTNSPLAGWFYALEQANKHLMPLSRVSEHFGWQWDGTFRTRDGIFHPDLEHKISRYATAGTYEAWTSILNDYEGSPDLIFAVAASLSSCLLEVVGCDPFTVDFSGSTSRGKSTILKLAASVWGSPKQVSEGGQIDTWADTPLAIALKHKILRGVPAFLDDTNRARAPEVISEILYAVAEGRTKAQGQQGGGYREGVLWRTILMTSGERLVTTYTQHGGTRARTVAVVDPSIEHPMGQDFQTLNERIEANYGHLGPLFIKWLEAGGERLREELKSDWLKKQATLRMTSSLDKVQDRRSQYVALIWLAAEKIGAGKSIKLGKVMRSVEYFSGITFGSGVERADEDVAYGALQSLLQQCRANQDRFWAINKGTYPPHGMAGGVSGWWGRRDRENDDEPFMLFPRVVEKLLRNDGYEWKEVKGTWRERGWIRARPNEYVNRQYVIDKPQRVVELTLQALNADSFEA